MFPTTKVPTMGIDRNMLCIFQPMANLLRACSVPAQDSLWVRIKWNHMFHSNLLWVESGE
jgi:hypothetical protein